MVRNEAWASNELIIIKPPYNVYTAVTNVSLIILLSMMDASMFTCYYCHAKMDDLQHVQCVAGHCKSQHCDVSGNSSYLIKDDQQRPVYSYEVIADVCQIDLQKGSLI